MKSLLTPPPSCCFFFNKKIDARWRCSALDDLHYLSFWLLLIVICRIYKVTYWKQSYFSAKVQVKNHKRGSAPSILVLPMPTMEHEHSIQSVLSILTNRPIIVDLKIVALLCRISRWPLKWLTLQFFSDFVKPLFGFKDEA